MNRFKTTARLAIVLFGMLILAIPASHSQEKREKKETAKATSGMNHGKPHDGLAAFLRCDRKQFQVGKPIGMMFGVINTGPGLGSEHDSPPQPKSIYPAMGPLQPDSPSWFSVTGPNGKEISYTGPVIDFQLNPDGKVKICHRQFIDRYCSDMK